MAIVMDMSSYAVEETPAHRGDGEMYAGWNPQLEIATQQSSVALMGRYPGLPTSLVHADADAFLRKMYAHRR